MKTNPMEIFLARIFADPNEVERFLQDRAEYAKQCGLGEAQLEEIWKIDAVSLRFAARSYERKRQRGN